jgi:ABC-type cobalamin/Fe3+-siderophores transport system ATPase subunit
MVKLGLPSRGLFPDRQPAAAAEDRQKVEAALTRLGLEELRHRAVLSLSGGEFQKVLLCRTLVQDPAILLLDEPANHLDLKYQNLIFALVKEECKNGKAAAAVVHDINQALSWADRLLILDRGRPVYQGPPRMAAEGTHAGPAGLKAVLEEVYDLKFVEFSDATGRRTVFHP